MEFNKDEFNRTMQQGTVRADELAVVRFKVVCFDGTVFTVHATSPQRAAMSVLYTMQTQDEPNILGVVELP